MSWDMGKGDAASLSAAARSVWAKYDHETAAWLPLYQHMLDSAGVAWRLWEYWLAGNVRNALADLLGGPDQARRLLSWLAGVHDIGKATPSFAEKVEPLQARMAHHGLEPLPGRNTDFSQHWAMSHVALSQWLQEAHGFRKATAEAFGCVLGGHHGHPPPESQLRDYASAGRMGKHPWQAVREELLTWLAAQLQVGDILPTLREVRIPQTMQVLLSAGVIVADWIASNTDYYPLVGPTGGVSEDRGHYGWSALGLPLAWEPEQPARDPEALLRTRFPFLTQARPLQLTVVEQAWQAPRPSMIVVEAPMGAGKTEAALAAAEVLAHRFECSGVFVALPTMATTDAMFGRVKAWIEHLPGGGALTTYLAHSKAGLNDEFTRLPSDIRISGLFDDGLSADSSVAAAHSWLRGRKKGVLATFVVATIDQVLFGALKSRHLALRHLALVGKVVVVDEVHAADEYMRTYLARILHWLGAYHVPVILLSATLPPGQREQLVTAYQSGAAPPVRVPGGSIDDLYG